MKLIALLAVLSLLPMAAVQAASLYDVPVKDIDGQDTTLAPYKGKVLLIVNVASHCGYTPQYAALESLYLTNQDQGLVVLGFPCNQFGAQEPGSNQEIKAFCSGKYNVTFPLFDKLEVNGPNRHPLYVKLAGPDAPFPGDIGWNFTKFLIGRDGRIIARYPSRTTPTDPQLLKDLADALAKH